MNQDRLDFIIFAGMVSLFAIGLITTLAIYTRPVIYKIPHQIDIKLLNTRDI